MNQIERVYHGCVIISTQVEKPVMQGKERLDDGWSHELMDRNGKFVGKYQTLGEAIGQAKKSDSESSNTTKSIMPIDGLPHEDEEN